LNFESKTHEA
jgi:hypothetical protein